jgi:hypothetical protein
MLGLIPFVLQPSLLVSSFLILPLQIKLLVGLFGIIGYVGLGLLEVVLQHASHSIEFEALIIVHLILHLLLLLPLTLLLHLLVQPLFLFLLEKLSTGVVLYYNKLGYLGLHLRTLCNPTFGSSSSQWAGYGKMFLSSSSFYCL